MLTDAFSLLKELIATPSVSRDESATAAILEHWLRSHGIKANRHLNNVWALSEAFDPSRPTLLLNSHHDTVKPSASYTLDPFTPTERNGRLYGLGSNDAGASVVALAETFRQLYNEPLGVNLVLALTAEEEVSGKGGIEALLNHFKELGISADMAIVGEPTAMQAAVAERGLVVLDCTARGVSGHAARSEGVNAISVALDDIATLRNFHFDKISPSLGDIKISVTQINAGTQHNVIPDRCDFVVDVRTTDAYTNRQTVELISDALQSEVSARSTRLQASSIDPGHPLVKAAVCLGAKTFVSPTMSDRALLHGIPALKIGPGDSARSHSADEYVLIDEIDAALKFYNQLIRKL